MWTNRAGSRRAAPRDLPLLELVQKGLVADIQTSCGMTAIPIALFKDAQDDFSFCAVGCHRRNRFQGNRIFRGWELYDFSSTAASRTRGSSGSSGHFWRIRLRRWSGRTDLHVQFGKYEVSPHRIFELADVARPVVAHEDIN